MNFELTNEQKDIQKLARDFAEKELLPQVRERDESGEFPWRPSASWVRPVSTACPIPRSWAAWAAVT